MEASPHLLGRHAHQVTHVPNSKLNLSVLQWNTLARCYTSQKHYPFLPSKALVFEERDKMIEKEIKSYNADVICLEEVDKTDLQFFSSLYPREEYSFSYVKKPHSKDGICIMIKKSFEVFDEEMIEHTNEKNEKQNLVSQVVVAKQKKENEEFCLIVSACHLKAADFAPVRLLQAKQIIETIEKKKQKCINLGYKKENILIVVCGDFNDYPDSLPAQEFLQHKDLNLKSEFDDYEYTLFQKYGNRTYILKIVVDFIMHSDSLVLTKKIDPPAKDRVGEDGLLSLEFPSDHLSLFCELALPENAGEEKVEKEENEDTEKQGKSFCSVF